MRNFVGQNLIIIKTAFISLVFLMVFSMAYAGISMREDLYIYGLHLSLLKNDIKGFYSGQILNLKNRFLTAGLYGLFSSNKINIESTEEAVSIPIIQYHGIVNVADGFNITDDNFKDQLFKLKEAGWQTVSFEDLVKFMKGEISLPKKSFVITFDDGSKNSFYPVDPILKALNYKAVTFVISHHLDDLDSSYYLSTLELQKMKESGRWSIQSHSQDAHDPVKINERGELGYFYSNRIWLENGSRLETEQEYQTRVLNDLKESKEDLEQKLGITVAAIAYPFGDYGQYQTNYDLADEFILENSENIYEFGFYQSEDTFSHNFPNKDSFLLKRIKVNPVWNGNDLVNELSKGLAKDLAYTDRFDENNGWINVWGDSRVGGGSLTLTPKVGSSTAFVILDGTYAWTDYLFQTRGVFNGTLSLVVRYIDDQNYLSCDFDSNGTKLVLTQNGKKTILAEKIQKFDLQENLNYNYSNSSYSIEVRGQVASCYSRNDEYVGIIGNASIPANGGIGFKIWNEDPQRSKAVITESVIYEITN